jgi:uncharacterized HAD superfamily protein
VRISLDVDGVIAKSPARFLAVREHRGDLDAPPPVKSECSGSTSVAPPRLRETIEFLRFFWRTPVPNVRATLQTLARDHQLYFVTGRSVRGERVLKRWLRNNGLLDYATAVVMSPSGLHTWEHKLLTCREHNLDIHVDDDPFTALYLARNGVPRVFLIDPSMQPRDNTPPNLTTLPNLAAFATVCHPEPRGAGPS